MSNGKPRLWLVAGTVCLVSFAALADGPAEDDSVASDRGPWLTACEPETGTTGVSADVRPAFQFGREMNPATINANTFSLSGPGGVRVAGAPTYRGTIGTFVPAARLSAGTAYTTLVTTGARDRDGNALDRDYRCAFTTAAAAAAVMQPAPTRAPEPVMVTRTNDRRWYVAPMFAYSFPASFTEEGPGWQLAVGKDLNSQFSLEASVTERRLELDGAPGSSHETSMGLNALWYPNRNAGFAPYLLLGAGAHQQDIHRPALNQKETMPYGTAGAGFLLWPWSPKSVAIRGGAQWLHPFGDDYNGDGEALVTLGMQLYFGS